MTLIGLSGDPGAGKDTMADFLVAECGFTKLAFADPLRRMVANLNPIVHAIPTPQGIEILRYNDAIEAFGYNEAKKRLPEVRDTLRRMGTEVMRAEDPQYWIKQVEQRLLYEFDTPDVHVVVPDMRFNNEAAFIVSQGGSCVHISRQDADAPHSIHISDTELRDWPFDFEIENNSTLDDFYASILECLGALHG